MVIFGMSIHMIEPETFPNLFEGIWWAFVTATTVGYGDYVPDSIGGKILAILLILTGGAIIAFYITTFARASIRHERNLSKGKVAFKGSSHIVLIGWNERARQLLEIINERNYETRVVLIDQTLNHIAFEQYPVHFIQGDAKVDYTLMQANIEQADGVIITADPAKKERSDDFTILSTTAVRGNNKNIPIIVEIFAKNQIENAKRAGATTVLKTNEFMSVLLYHEIYRVNNALPFEDLLQLLETQEFHHAVLDEALENKAFIDAAYFYLQEQRLLLGIIRDGESMINPGGGMQLKENDTVIMLKTRKQNSAEE